MNLETANRSLVDLADNEVFIFLTYFFGIGAWAVISKHDFISGNWKSVVETRKSGQAHVIIVLIPMFYVGFYIYVLALRRDFKLGAAVFAFAFAGLHLLRTIFGLWQLTVFKSWAVSAIDSIESLGYRCYSADGIEPDLEGLNLSEKEATDIRIGFIVDRIRVSNQVVENKLSSGVCISKLRLITKAQLQFIENRKFWITKGFLWIYYVCGSVLRLPFVLIALFSPTFWDLSDKNCAPFLEPIFAEEVFVRWSCTLVANACPEWLEDMRNLCKKPEEGENVKERDLRREEFALELLLSAGMHLRERSVSGKLSGFRDSGNDFGCTEEFCSFRHNFLPFVEWYQYPTLCKGLFRREEFLKHACLSGKGLPFHASHYRAQLFEKGEEGFSYSKFGTFLNQAKLALDAEDEEACVGLGIVELEWLSVFLSVDTWRGICPESKRAQEEELRKSKKKRFTETIVKKKKKKKIEVSGLPLSNLSTQLGYRTVTPRMLRYFSHPVLKTSDNRTLWENRNVLELSAHIDNWLALRSGEKTKYMMKQMDKHHEDFLIRNIEAVCDASSVFKNIFDRSVSVQIDQSMFQFSLIEPEHHNYEHSMTFMGCSMEILRSSLARWIERNPLTQETSWNPKISSEQHRNCFTFRASEDLKGCVRTLKNLESLNSKYFQMRILWELQSYFHASMRRGSANSPGPMNAEAMILCILSFPSLIIKSVEKDLSNTSAKESQNSCCIQLQDDSKEFDINLHKLEIIAGAGPQDITVDVAFKYDDDLVLDVELTNNESKNYFSWESWKHAFLGRLEGARKWQTEWNLPTIPVFKSDKPISAGIALHKTLNSKESPSISVWEGWIPHRPRMCQFEIESKGFIKRRLQLSQERMFLSLGRMHVARRLEKERYLEVEYANADPESFRRASIFAVEAIKNDYREGGGLPYSETADKFQEFKVRVGNIARNRHFAIELLKYSAVEFSSLEDLEYVIKLLSSTNYYVEDAVKVLERFYTVSGNLDEFFSDSDKVQKIENVFSNLLVDSNYRSKVAVSFSKFYITALSYGVEEMYGKARKMLFQSMIENMRSKNKVAALECRFALQDLVRTDRSEELTFTKTALRTTIDPQSHLIGNAPGKGEGGENRPAVRAIIPGYSFLRWMKQNLKKATRELPEEPGNMSFDQIDLERGISDARETLEILSDSQVT